MLYRRTLSQQERRRRELGEEEGRLGQDTHTHTDPAQLVQSAHTHAQLGDMLKRQGEKPEVSNTMDCFQNEFQVTLKTRLLDL